MKSVFALSPKKDEPYLTQVFSFLLNSDNKFCNYVIKNIFGLITAGNVFEITPEFAIEGGRPDIVIKCENERIAIENKIDANFTTNQIGNFKKEFSYVFLIYKYLSDPTQASLATNSFTWYRIYSAIKSYIQTLSDSYDVVNKYLLQQFITYLEETNRGVEQVSWAILDGTRALSNLYAQMTEALERFKGEQKIKRYGWAGSGALYTGWKLILDDKENFNVYVFYYPFRIFSAFYEQKDWSSEYKPIGEIYPEITWLTGIF